MHFPLLFTAVELLRSEFVKLGPFWWMVWNGLLALIPVALAIFFFRRSAQPETTIGTLLFFGQVFVVMLFLPNAPYVATDLIHFVETARTTDLSLWKLLGTEFPIYVAFVLLGLLSYSFVTDRMLHALRMRFGRRAYYVGLFLIPFLCSIGIYLGRVARFNSWDIVSDPFSIWRSSRSALHDAHVIKIVIAMTILLMLVHQFYKVVHDGVRVRFFQKPRRFRMRMRRRKSVPEST